MVWCSLWILELIHFRNFDFVNNRRLPIDQNFRLQGVLPAYGAVYAWIRLQEWIRQVWSCCSRPSKTKMSEMSAAALRRSKKLWRFYHIYVRCRIMFLLFYRETDPPQETIAVFKWPVFVERSSLMPCRGLNFCARFHFMALNDQVGLWQFRKDELWNRNILYATRNCPTINIWTYCKQNCTFEISWLRKFPTLRSPRPGGWLDLIMYFRQGCGTSMSGERRIGQGRSAFWRTCGVRRSSSSP